MTPWKEILRLQRNWYAKVMRSSLQYRSEMPRELKEYHRRYQKDLAHFKQRSSKTELMHELQHADIAIVGDYHILPQSQKTSLRVIREVRDFLISKGRQMVIALEMLPSNANGHVEEYSSGKISEKEFLRCIHFDQRWGVGWSHYREVFLFAKANGIRLIGINHPRVFSLKKRDEYAASVMAEESKRKDFILALVGDWHLASPHLPKELQVKLMSLGLKRKIVIVHQNYENTYWKLAQTKSGAGVDVVKIRKNVYCIVNTPPWIKVNHYIHWMAEVFNDEKGEIDLVDEANEIVSVLSQFWGVPSVKSEVMARVNDPFPLRAMNQFSKREKEILSDYSKVFDSFFVPDKNIILKTLSLNHLATQGSIFLHAALTGFNQMFRNPRRDFYTFLWIEALGFLGSKIINHRRRCTSLSDLSLFLKRVKSHGSEKLYLERVKLSKFVLNSFHMEKKKRDDYLPISTEKPTFYYQALKILGRILGQALFQAFLDQKIKKNELTSLYLTRFEALRGGAFQFYLHWIRRLDNFGYRNFSKHETF